MDWFFGVEKEDRFWETSMADDMIDGKEMTAPHGHGGSSV